MQTLSDVTAKFFGTPTEVLAEEASRKRFAEYKEACKEFNNFSGGSALAVDVAKRLTKKKSLDDIIAYLKVDEELYTDTDRDLLKELTRMAAYSEILSRNIMWGERNLGLFSISKNGTGTAPLLEEELRLADVRFDDLIEQNPKASVLFLESPIAPSIRYRG